MENKILTDLTIVKNGKRVNRELMVGMNIELIYKGKIYVVKILSIYRGEDGIKRFKIEHDGYINESGIYCQDFMEFKVGNMLNPNHVFDLNIGDVVTTNDRKLKILDRIHCENRVKYKYKCLECGNVDWKNSDNLLVKNKKCPVCTNQKITPKNCILTTDPWMVDLGMSKEDAKKYSFGSRTKVTFKCPKCENELEKTIADVYKNRTISCPFCDIGGSYPERFMCNALKQLGIDFQTQLSKTTFDWCGKYRYDFYIPYLNMIIETHGLQHYKKTNKYSKFQKTLQEEQENDKIKQELALKNGIDKYVIIDCRYSNFDFIKNNIINSDLKEIFDLSNIDWNEINKNINKGYLSDVWNNWNNKKDWETTKTIAQDFGLSKTTIINYLKIGANIGKCNYNNKEEMRKSQKRTINSRKKSVCVYYNGVKFGIFNSAKDVSDEILKSMGVFIHRSTIGSCAREKRGIKGYTFEYVIREDKKFVE